MANVVPEIMNLEHESANVEGKRMFLYGHDGSNWVRVKVDSSGKLVVAFTATGVYTPTNVTTDRSFDADTVAIAELADIVGTLIIDLQTKNVIE